MPTYTYQCTSCGSAKDFIKVIEHQIPTAKEVGCSKNCQEPKIERVYKPLPIHFKGSGWTETTSQNTEKNKTLKKLYNDSKMGDMGAL